MWLRGPREHHEARRGPVLGIVVTASFAADLPKRGTWTTTQGVFVISPRIITHNPVEAPLVIGRKATWTALS